MNYLDMGKDGFMLATMFLSFKRVISHHLIPKVKLTVKVRVKVSPWFLGISLCTQIRQHTHQGAPYCFTLSLPLTPSSYPRLPRVLVYLIFMLYPLLIRKPFCLLLAPYKQTPLIVLLSLFHSF